MRADPEPEPSERPLVEVLAAEYGTPVTLPMPNPALLPFGELSPPEFERLVAEVVLYVDGLQQVRVYGRSGQAQGGLDIVGGPATARSVYQVRRIAELTPAALRIAVEDYAGRPGSGRDARRFRAHRFVLATACPASDTKVDDELDLLQREYEGDLEIDLYDGGQLRQMLRHRGGLVAAVFGAAWAWAHCNYRLPELVVAPSGRLLLDDPVDILGYSGVRARADASLVDDPLAAAEIYRDLAEQLRKRGMDPAAQTIERRRRGALASAGRFAEAFAVTVDSALGSYDRDEGHALAHLTEADSYLAHLGEVEQAVLVVVDAVVGWAHDGHPTDHHPDGDGDGEGGVASVVAALDVLVTAEHELAVPLAARIVEQVVTDADPAVPVGPLLQVGERLLPLAVGEWRVRLGCGVADLAVLDGADPREAFAEMVRRARRFDLDEALVALVLRRAAFAHAGYGRDEEAVDLYRAAVVHSSTAGLGGDTRDALQALSALSSRPGQAAHTVNAVRAISTRERVLPGADGAALETLELLVDDQLPAALAHARTWVRHERINGALRDEWVARRRLGQVLQRLGEDGDAVEQFVRAGARDDATSAARSTDYVDMSRHLRADVDARTKAAAAAAVAAQADVLPDDALTDVSTSLLAMVVSSPPIMMFTPAPARHALGALAAMGPRLPREVAEAVLPIIEPLVPRRAVTARLIDDEVVAALATIARWSDEALARRAGAALVAAVGQGLRLAADAVASLSTSVPGLEAEVQAQAQAPNEQNNGDQAVRVLAVWNQWHPFMATATRSALVRLFAHPVGQERSSFPLGGAGPQRAALLLRAALGSAEPPRDLVDGLEEVVEHLLLCIEDTLDIAESRDAAAEALVLLADWLTGQTRAAAFTRLVAVHDNPGWNPSDLFTQASLAPRSEFRFDTGNAQFPLACLRTAAVLAVGEDETHIVIGRLRPHLLGPTQDRHAAPLLERALQALAPVTPLPLEQLAVHPVTAVRRAAAYCWERQTAKDWDVAGQLARDPWAVVRLRIAHALRDADDQPDSPGRQLLDELRRDASNAVRRAAAGSTPRFFR